jgi:ketosteroid isomerase-like protein
MTDATALDVALAYHRAWTGHDFEAAMQYLADDIVCQSPGGPIEGAEAFRGFMEPFSKILLESALVSAFGDASTALLMYDTRTVPVADAPGAELLTVHDGRITHLRIIFDRLPFTQARAADAQ